MLNFEVHGEGKALVLLHGFCENNTCFNKQVLLLKDHCKVIVPDMPGFGKSQTINQLSIEDMAMAVKELTDSLQLDQFTLMGHSMGGYVTLAFADLFPSTLNGFGLIHSTAKEDSPERKEKRLQVVKFIEEQGVKTYVHSFIPNLFLPENRSKNYVEEALLVGKNTAAEGIIAAALAMRQRPNREKILTETRLPVFFGIGKGDELIPAHDMFAQAALCEQAYVSLFQHSAHMAMDEEPTLLANKMLDFLLGFKLI